MLFHNQILLGKNVLLNTYCIPAYDGHFWSRKLIKVYSCGLYGEYKNVRLKKKSGLTSLDFLNTGMSTCIFTGIRVYWVRVYILV